MKSASLSRLMPCIKGFISCSQLNCNNNDKDDNNNNDNNSNDNNNNKIFWGFDSGGANFLASLGLACEGSKMKKEILF